jgi:hypothetical protein
MEIFRQQLVILRQDRTDDHALAIRLHHVDQLCGIVLDLVGHFSTCANAGTASRSSMRQMRTLNIGGRYRLCVAKYPAAGTPPDS